MDLLAHNLDCWPDRVAFIDGGRGHTYREVAERAGRLGRGLLDAGLAPGDRLALCMHDGVDLACAFLGAMRAGILPMPLNTLLTPGDYAHILRDSGAAGALVSPSLLPHWSLARLEARWQGPLWTEAPLAPEAGPAFSADPEDPAFLLYSSGSTGQPKGVVHSRGSLLATAGLFGTAVLGLGPDDVVYSAAKLFFAYGLGNSLTFPLSAGAACVLRPERVTPDLVWRVLRQHRVTVFCGVPTLFASLLASPDFPPRGELALRLCVSAGEPMPAEISRAWTARTGVEIVDGVGSTEMLHIFLCKGRPVDGYETRLVEETGGDAPPDGLGELHVRGPSAALGYWNNPTKSAATFVDGWVRTGDQFRRGESGDYAFCGRADDMLKVSGIWVSPAEVENVLIAHEAVREAAVVGVADAHGLTKAKAYVVLRPEVAPSEQLGLDLQAFAKSRLAPHKYPRQIEFVPDLPRTATGKVRRHMLREA